MSKANLKARKNKDGKIIGYQIRIYGGLDENGVQKMNVTSYKADPSLTEEENEKRALAMAQEFEEQCSKK